MMRRLIALLCIALVVFVAMAPAASSHFSDVLLPLSVALFPVLALVVSRPRAERRDEQPVSLLSRLFPRPPPISPVLV